MRKCGDLGGEILGGAQMCCFSWEGELTGESGSFFPSCLPRFRCGLSACVYIRIPLFPGYLGFTAGEALRSLVREDKVL